VKDTKFNRSLFQLQASVLRTEEKESGSLLPTPRAKEPGRTTKGYGRGLAELVEGKEQVNKMWRTPDAHCDRGASSEKRMKMKLDKGMPISINDQVAHPNLMWPTPTSTERSGINPKTGKGAGLSKAVKMWPTPRASKAMGEDVTTIRARNKDRSKLEERVALWPTPTVDAAHNRATKYKQGGTSLATAAKMWPTPNQSPVTTSQTVEATLRLRKRDRKQGQLMEAVVEKMFPTPTARDHKDSGPNTNYEKARAKSRLAGSAGGSLNPTWVEWLMGYPAGYTDLKDWEILSSRKSRKKSVEPSSQQKEPND
jgi:hypothetical protein